MDMADLEGMAASCGGDSGSVAVEETWRFVWAERRGSCCIWEYLFRLRDGSKGSRSREVCIVCKQVSRTGCPMVGASVVAMLLDLD
jgi:hypothetical protein